MAVAATVARKLVLDACQELTAQTQSLFEETSRDLVRVTTQLKYFLRLPPIDPTIFHLHSYRITTFPTSTEG